MKNILVVGGAGYIGGITTDLLKKSGHHVTVYDKLLYEPRYLKDVDFIYGDIRDSEKLLGIHKKFDEIIWLAAIVGDGACQQDPKLTREVNVNSIKNFLDKAKRRVVFTSTCSVYGAQEGVMTEESPASPLSIYAATKLEAEEYVLSNGGLVFRLGTLFGLGDSYSRIRLDLVVNIMAMRAYREKRLTVFGGEQWRPLLAVKDVANYLVESVDKDIAGLFNLMYKNYKISSLAEQVAESFSDVKVEFTEMKFEDLRSYQVDNSKSIRHFAFRPSVTIGEEVKRMSKLFEEHRIKNPDDSVYYNAMYVKDLVESRDKEI